ncbi:MAG TPA: hypothetical protein VGQ76_24380 [Thermoanaerobaculia bacterium]|nr:hypothetical protein [Thermoanaerobaculia bacterium]
MRRQDRLFATYFGGTQAEVPNGMAVDAAGRVTFCGIIRSPNLPTANAAQPVIRGDDGFVTRLQLATPKKRAARH